MDTETLTAEVPDTLGVPVDRLYPISAAFHDALRAHGLLTARDGVALVDGLLVHTPEGPGAAADPLDRLYRMPLGVYDRVSALGLLGPDDRTELLDGLLVKKMTKEPPHTVATLLTGQALAQVFPAGWHVRKEDPVVLATGPKGRASVPEPDLAVIRGNVRDHATRHPVPAEMALVVEVADSSLRSDRVKLGRFAWANVPVAWVVNVNDRVVEVHGSPSGPVTPARYEQVVTYGANEAVPVVVDGREAGRVAVVDLLP